MNYVARALEVDETRWIHEGIVDSESDQILAPLFWDRGRREIMPCCILAMMGPPAIYCAGRVMAFSLTHHGQQLQHGHNLSGPRSPEQRAKDLIALAVTMAFMNPRVSSTSSARAT